MSALQVLVVWSLAAAGCALVASELPWFRRTRRLTRLAPYSRRPHEHTSAGTAANLRQVIAPGLERWGARLSSAVGVADDLQLRLERAGATLDPSTFRLRQAGRAIVALLGAAGFVLVVALPPLPALVAVLGAPALVVLLEEQRLTAAIERRRARALAELPVVTEQLGLLLSAGYSLPGATARLAARSDGAIAADLRAVVRRTRHGLSPTDALSEWAAATGSDAIGRLVAVLRLHDDAGDLGALISEEARSIRAGAHRDLVEQIERRSQLVWVPVTVATLVPGLIFLAVPFMSAMAQVTGG
jgi:Flp pilus assembly protein TadB